MIAVKHDDTPRPVSLRLSVTDRCQMRCRYCTPSRASWSSTSAGALSHGEMVKLVAYLQQESGVAKVRITGGEPLACPDLDQLIAGVSALGVPDIALTTNGLHLKRMAPVLKRAGLHRVNVSLDSLSSATFQRITGSSSLAQVIAGIDAALEWDLGPVKLNMVVVGGENEAEASDVLRFAVERACELRFIELMPIGPGGRLFESSFVSSEASRVRLEEHFDLDPLPVEAGSSARRYRVTDVHGRRGIAGFISPCTLPFCNDCNRLRVTASGHLLGCLARPGRVALQPALAAARVGDRRPLAEVVSLAMAMKREPHNLPAQASMVQVGG